MSERSPEFVMPPPVSTAVSVPTVLAGPAPIEPDGDDSEPRPSRVPTRLARSLLAVGAAGLIIGAAAQAGVLAVLEATADAQIAIVESVAMDYLIAIAEGRAADATALVPPTIRGAVAPDAVLEGAGAIRDYSAAVLGPVEGDAAVVLVEFTVGGLEQQRLLDAARIDERWRILTSLTEIPDVWQYDQLATAMISGVALEPRGRVLLYPGAYRQEVVDSGLYRTAGNAFVIDGDPETTTEVWSGIDLDMETSVTAAGLARGTLEACQAATSCGVPPGAFLQQLSEPELRSINLETGGVTIGATFEIADRSVEVRIRAMRDPETQRTQWLCPEPSRLDLPTVPCGR